MEEVTKWEDVSFVISSSYRIRILKSLSTPKTPSKLSSELDINKTHISRALSELEERNMIECLTPSSRKGKIYKISILGKEILSNASKLQM